MKRQLAFALAVIMIFSAALTGCGKKADSGKQPKSSSSPKEEVVRYTEEKPQDNQLIYESPIPPETETLKLTEQEYKDLGFKLQLPPDVNAEEGEGVLTASDSKGSWTVTFEPFEQGELYKRRFAADHGLGEDRCYREADHCDTEIWGYPAFVCAANIKSTGKSLRDEERIPEYTIILDYGEEYVGKWAGIQITLRPTKYDEKTNIYEYLYLRHVRSLLNGFETMKSYGGKLSAGGITAKLPERWSPKAEEESGALTAHIVNGKQKGGLLITSVNAHDSAAYAKSRAVDAEVFTKDYGGTRFTGFIRNKTSASVDEEGGKIKTETLIAELYSEMGDGRIVMTAVSLRSADSESLNTFLDSEVFSDTMASISADPSGYSPSSASAMDFTCTGDGYINSYTGQNTDITIPSEVGGVTITGIAENAFKSSKVTSVTIPAGITEIDSKAFYGCKNLTQLNLPEGLLFIDSKAFEGCKKLSSVTIPSSVSYIGCEAFQEAGKGGSFECLGDPKIDSRALTWSGFGSITMQGGDLSAPYIMNGCSASEIVLNEGVEKIGQDCMSGCMELSSVSLPHALKKLGKYCMADDPKLHNITIPERLELIPEGCFDETALDVLIIPENITGMEHYAVTNAAYLVLTNPKIKLAMEAFNVERLYMHGVHLSEETPVGLEYQYVAMQVYLAMDSTPKETEDMDNFLNGIGFGEIAWIGTEPFMLPDNSADYNVNEDYEVTSTKDKEGLYIPHCAFGEEENHEIYAIKKKAFRGKDFKEIYFNPGLEIVSGNAFADNSQLTDLWFSGAVTYQMQLETVSAGCFYGLPDNITVHLPARIPAEERTPLEEKLKLKGIPNSAVFDYYTL